MRDRINRKIFFWKLIAFFTMLSLIIVILLTIVFRSIYMDATYKEVTDEYQNSLNRISMDIRQLNEEVDYLFISVISNPVVDTFLSRKAWDPIEEYKVRTEFARFKHIHSKIASMYIYSGKMNYFVSTQTGGMDYSGFHDKEIIHAGGERKFIVSRTIESVGTEAPQKVVSYVYNKLAKDGVTVENSIVINVKDFAALNMLEGSKKLNVIIVDRGGRLVSTGVPEPIAGMALDESRWQSVISSPEPSGSSKMQFNGRKYIVSHLAVEGTDWSLITIQDHDEITAFVRGKTNQILYIGCAVLLLSVIPIALMARTIYSPIDLFIKRMTKSELMTKKSADKNNELDYIMDGVVDMLDRMKVLTEHHETSKQELRQSFLERLLTGALDESYIRAKSQEYDFHANVINRRVVLIRIDEYYKVKAEHRHLYEMTVEQIVKDVFQGTSCLDSVLLLEGKIAVIAHADGQPETDQLFILLKDVQNTVLKALGRSVTIGIGKPAETLRELKHSYEHAMSLSNHRLTAGYGKMLDEAYASSHLSVQHHYPAEIEKSLIDCIKLNKEAELNEALKQLEEALQSYTHTGAHLILMQLAVSCIRTINGILGENYGQFDIQEYYRKIDELEVLNDWTAWLHDLFVQCRKRIEEMNLQKNTGKTAKMIQEAIEYIEENYSDANLTVDSIAERFGYSPNYFAKLFKESTGEFINDHIRSIKIKRAKNLLKETKLAVNEIAQLTGYINKNYFFYAFKKDTGMTPLSYRELNGLK